MILSYSYFSQFQCLCLTLLVIHAVYIHLWHKMFTFYQFWKCTPLHYRTRQACMDLASFPGLRREGPGNEASLDYTSGCTQVQKCSSLSLFPVSSTLTRVSLLTASDESWGCKTSMQLLRKQSLRQSEKILQLCLLVEPGGNCSRTTWTLSSSSMPWGWYCSTLSLCKINFIATSLLKVPQWLIVLLVLNGF